ncbi:chitin deacetylase [Entomortierella beljakovae]|nr:chitin deacetylase [Entomortierella beljakovae]
MAQISSLQSIERLYSKRASYRTLVRLAAILIVIPTILKVVSADPKVSTEQAINTLLTHSSTIAAQDSGIDFHGLTIPISDILESDSSDQTGDQDSTIGSESEGEGAHRSSSRHGKSRINVSIYPPKDKTPDVNSPQVKAWVAEIDWSKVPNIPVATELPDVPHFPKCPPLNELDRSACWWSCAGCVAPDDIVTCPSKDNWGLTYDDGPSAATRDMLQYLNSQKLTATFFIVGSRVLQFADILKEQIAQGHHIGMHTWSHAALTTLTNEQIVAEIKWTEKIIRDFTGLTMKYVRPPYGDTDNRVREIVRQMGYITVIWSKGWDTNDWRMLQGQIQEAEIVQNFNAALNNRSAIVSSNGGPGGPVTLEHDLTNATISVSKQLIPMALTSGLKPMSLADCLNDQTPYQHGQRLGPGGGTEYINNGEGKHAYRGMPGMEEQDFKHVNGGKSPSKQSPGSAADGKNSAATLVDYSRMSIVLCFFFLLSSI